MQTKIIVDSTVDMKQGLKNTLPIVPLTVHFGQEEYIDGVTLTNQAFYEKLAESDVMPTTSQATPDAFSRAFAEITRQGMGAVVLTVSSALSGTYQSAMIAAEEYEHIYIVDTGSVAIGAGILAELAVALAEQGMEAKQIAQRLEQEKSRVRLVALVDTLEYLKRGGRISKTVAFAGGLLNMKPLLSVAEGQITVLGKARGAKQGAILLDEEIKKAGGVDFSMPVLLGYTGVQTTQLETYIKGSDLWKATTPSTTIIGSVIGTHAGPGAVAVAFFRN